ncbi:hypothetical protein EVAR_21712_1 [Eumeta japonica]|uniref:Uncharacterized protein n=1 Tax=Eumeta variegata TaxID=151549 RepID=A0A4C1W4X4_EUMVA|nr:hypothetical protein EVAR_21712_1 [Eumeta japonica]
MERASKDTPKERSTSNDAIDVRPSQPSLTETRPFRLRNRGDHENGPARPTRYHARTEYRREIAASAVVFHSVSDKSGETLSSSSPHSPSINPFPPDQIFYPYPRGRQCAGDS